jgi:DNA repair exonuclease SbcCD ATPase subunit
VRIHRITIRNFRGVDERTVEFATNGVTVLEGENEVGKSSVIDALFMLLEYLDTSQAKEVKAARPIPSGRDPEVSAEISAGDYQFVYEKCYGSTAAARFTRLAVSTPRPEQLIGTEAHERVAHILRESVDEALWKALRLQQGVALEQEQLLTGSSLGAALDAAAGGAKGGDRENTLFARVTEEYEKFYTAKTGKEKNSIVDPSSAAASAGQSLEDLERQMQELQRDAERCESRATELTSLGPKEKDQRSRVDELEEKWKKIEAEQQREEGLHLKLELAEKSLQAAEQTLNTRREKVGAVERAQKEVGALEEEHRRASPGFEALTATLAEAADRLKIAREILDGAQTAQTVRTKDESHLRDQFDVLLFRERLDHVAEAQSAALEAEAFLEGALPDQEAVEQIEKAQTEVLQASARLESGSPSIRVSALTDFVLGIDGDRRQLDSDDHLDLTAPQPLTLRIGDVAEVTIVGGKDAAALKEDLEGATRRVQQLCLAVGAKDLSDARTLLHRRDSEEARLVNAKKMLAQSLYDQTPESLAAKLSRALTKVAEYPVSRDSALPLPRDLTEAKRLVEEADAELKRAKTGVDDAFSAHSRLQGDANERDKQAFALTVRLGGAKDSLAEALADLAKARAVQTDGAVESQVLEAKHATQTASADHEEAAARLRAADPETASSLLENEREVLQRLQTEAHKLELELADLRGTLRQRGEEGLADRRDSMRAETMRLQRKAEAVRSRASAAKLLFETLSRRRDASRKAYIKPFKDKIESLGRFAFGPSFSVELRDTLQVERRTFNGVTLEFEKLSTGAKEQIGVIARLACASIVSAKDGVPLILDDALGSSDSGRLARLGAAFNAAARDCQVIILTCQPDRYRHIGSAKVIRLA